MEVSFRNTNEDFEALFRSSRLLNRIRGASGWFRGLSVSAVPGLVLLAICGPMQSLISALGVIGVLFVAVVWLIFRTRPTQHSEDSMLFQDQTIRLTETAFEGSDASGWSRRAWSRIDRVETNDSAILVSLDNQGVHWIPRSAFESEAAADRFAHQVQGRIRQPPEFSFQLTPPVDAGVVEYQLTTRDIIAYERGDDYKAGIPGAAMLFFAIGCVLICFGEATDMIGFLLMYLTTGILLIRIWPWLFRAKFKPTPIKVTVDSAGMTSCEPGVESFRSWDGYHGYFSREDYLGIDLRPNNNAYLIPRTAFASAADEQNFESIVTSHLNKSKQPDESDETSKQPPPEFSESGNPYQTPPGNDE